MNFFLSYFGGSETKRDMKNLFGNSVRVYLKLFVVAPGGEKLEKDFYCNEL